MTSKTLTDAPADFVPFGKIHRLFRDIIITEKLDGTNAQVVIEDWRVLTEQQRQDRLEVDSGFVIEGEANWVVRAASRNRYIYPGNDNFGFAAWVRENQYDLIKLGVGRHYGEWWGQGIQRGYGLTERRFSLFNVSRWRDDAVRPACCHVVPVLYEGPFDLQDVEAALFNLCEDGSYAAPGYRVPEGIVIYHTQGNVLFKATLDGDGHKTR